MGKYLEGFSGKELRSAERVMTVLTGLGFSLNDLETYNKREKREPVNQSPSHNGKKKEPVKHPFLFPGETERVMGLKCVCGGSFVIEGLCGKQSAELGCVRLALCDSCPQEIRIR